MITKIDQDPVLWRDPYTLVAHAGQLRKGAFILNASHLLAVSALVLQYGDDEDPAFAALAL